MRYQYESKIRPLDFWALSMYRTYHSLVGVCNIVFAVAMILLTVRFWAQASDGVQALLFLACLLIPVIQPLGVYLKAKAQVSVIPQGTRLVFSEDGIHVTLGQQQEQIRWDKVKGVRREANMVIVYTDANHGYMLTDRVLGREKDAFFQFVEVHLTNKGNASKTSKKSKKRKG